MKTPQENFEEAMRLHDAGQLAAAAALYEAVVRAEPRHAHAWHHMGCIGIRNGKIDAATECFIRSIQSSGGMATSHNNLGECFRARGELDKALLSFKQAIRLDANYVAPRVNSSFALLAQGKRAEAQRYADEAMAMERRGAEEHCVAASLRLLLAELPDAWDEHEWRLELPGRVRVKPSGTKWDGRPLAGESVLLYAEQGLGDTLQFVRYVPLVEERGGRPVLAVHKRLIPLLRESGYREIVPNEEPLPACELHCALLSLGWAFRTTLDTVPAKVPYLRANADLAAAWKQRLSGVEGFRVGINWQGNPAYTFDRSRSIPLAQFASLARVEGARLVSLQKEQGLAQLAEQGGQFELVDLGEDLDVAAGPFMDTAAVMQQLDLVITSDTSVAHLAGALGVPTWVVLPVLPDWRWFLERDDCPWYPTMRLFRQAKPGDWNDVFSRVADELAREVARRRSAMT